MLIAPPPYLSVAEEELVHAVPVAALQLPLGAHRLVRHQVRQRLPRLRQHVAVLEVRKNIAEHNP